jgi:hypothetical protein
MQGQQNAYVPYLIARSAIAKIMDDMKNMKLKHVSIVTDIEGNFRGIEKETQVSETHVMTKEILYKLLH